MKVIALNAQNVKRLKAVAIEPTGSMVVVGGRNGAGKSSVLDSIMYALGGKDSLPEKPVREGQQEAIITLELGDLHVTRTILPDGGGSIVVRTADGVRQGSPQAILDKLVGDLSFDPLAFSKQKPAEQLATLKRLVGLDFSSLDKAKAQKYDQRTQVNRDIRMMQGQLAGMKRNEGVPQTEVPMSDLAEALQRAQAVNQKIEYTRNMIQQERQSISRQREIVARLQRQIDEATGEIKEAEARLNKFSSELDAADEIDTSLIVSQMQNLEQTNAKVRANVQRAKLQASLASREKESENITGDIDALELEKQTQLSNAEFPVAGLSFDETGVLVNGLPFAQASQAEQIGISVAMGIALNPKLKVLLVRDGSLLDSASLKILANMAEASGAQVWLEKVSEDGEGCSVVIENGEVRQ